MSVQLIKNFRDLQPYEADWNRLAPHPSMAFDWMKSWWEAFGAGHQLQVLVCSNEQGRVIGIAPWYLSRRMGTSTLKFLGSGKACSDFLQVMTEPGQEEIVETAVYDQLRLIVNRNSQFGFFRGLEFEGMQAENSPLNGLIARCAQDKFSINSISLESAWQIQLPETWEQHLAVLYSSFRRKVKKCVERIDSGVLQVHLAESAGQWQEAYDVLVQLHQARRKSMNSDGCFDDDRFRRFLNGAIPAMLSKGQARAAWLTADSKPIGAALMLLSPSYIGMYQSGIEPNSMQLEPGHTLSAFLIRDAIKRKVATFDFMRGDEPYKSLWRAKPVGLSRTVLVPNRLPARAIQGVETLSRQTFKRIKQLRTPPVLNTPQIPATSEPTST